METTEQLRAIKDESTNLVIIAGPGSGKTETLIRRIMDRQKYREEASEDVVVITYTQSAAREIRERLAAHYVGVGFAGTLHAYCYGLLREKFPQLAGVELQKASRESYRFVGKDILPLSQKVVAKFRREMLQDGLVDYDMLLTVTLELLETGGLIPKPVHLYVDELQDANDVDVAIYRALPKRSSVMVGDPDQSIFGFRGGNMEHIVCASREADVVWLTESHRCTKEICAAASRLMEGVEGRVPKTIYGRRSGTVPEWIWEEHESAINKRMVERVQQALNNGIAEKEVAVLFRTNALAETFSAAAAGYGVKVAACAERIDVEGTEWADVRRAVNLALAPWSSYNRKSCRVPGKELESFGGQLYDARARGLAGYLEWYGVSASVIRLVVARYAAFYCTVPGEAIEWDPQRWADYVVQLHTHYQVVRPESEGIYVGTIHAAKGKEWDTVLIGACENGLLPYKRGNLNEERRLMYVAMTRACNSLVLCGSRSRKIYDRPVAGYLDNLEMSDFVKAVFGIGGGS